MKKTGTVLTVIAMFLALAFFAGDKIMAAENNRDDELADTSGKDEAPAAGKKPAVEKDGVEKVIKEVGRALAKAEKGKDKFAEPSENVDSGAKPPAEKSKEEPKLADKKAPESAKTVEKKEPAKDDFSKIKSAQDCRDQYEKTDKAKKFRCLSYRTEQAAAEMKAADKKVSDKKASKKKVAEEPAASKPADKPVETVVRINPVGEKDSRKDTKDPAKPAGKIEMRITKGDAPKLEAKPTDVKPEDKKPVVVAKKEPVKPAVSKKKAPAKTDVAGKKTTKKAHKKHKTHKFDLAKCVAKYNVTDPNAVNCGEGLTGKIMKLNGVSKEKAKKTANAMNWIRRGRDGKIYETCFNANAIGKVTVALNSEGRVVINDLDLKTMTYERPAKYGISKNVKAE